MTYQPPANLTPNLSRRSSRAPSDTLSSTPIQLSPASWEDWMLSRRKGRHVTHDKGEIYPIRAIHCFLALRQQQFAPTQPFPSLSETCNSLLQVLQRLSVGQELTIIFTELASCHYTAAINNSQGVIFYRCSFPNPNSCEKRHSRFHGHTNGVTRFLSQSRTRGGTLRSSRRHCSCQVIIPVEESVQTTSLTSTILHH